jgi:hypothetical protein
MKHDDEAWLDALRGSRRPGDASSGAHAEGQLLRDALTLCRSAPAGDEAAAVQALDPGRENELIARAVRAGLIDPTAQSNHVAPVSLSAPRPRLAQRRHRMRAYLRPLLAAAVIAALAVGTAWWTQFPREVPEVVRGQEAVVLHDADPAALKQRLLAELRAMGVDAVGYEALGTHGIDADLPLPVTPEVSGLLRAHGIPVPVDGVLRIQIRERP